MTEQDRKIFQKGAIFAGAFVIASAIVLTAPGNAKSEALAAPAVQVEDFIEETAKSPEKGQIHEISAMPCCTRRGANAEFNASNALNALEKEGENEPETSEESIQEETRDDASTGGERICDEVRDDDGASVEVDSGMDATELFGDFRALGDDPEDHAGDCTADSRLGVGSFSGAPGAVGTGTPGGDLIPIYHFDVGPEERQIDPEIQRAIYQALDDAGIAYWYTGALAQCYQESRGDPTATNQANGIDKGLFQYREPFWDWSRGDIYDPEVQIRLYVSQTANRINAGLSVDEIISRHKTSDWVTVLDLEYIAQVKQWLGKMEVIE